MVPVQSPIATAALITPQRFYQALQAAGFDTVVGIIAEPEYKDNKDTRKELLLVVMAEAQGKLGKGVLLF